MAEFPTLSLLRIAEDLDRRGCPFNADAIRSAVKSYDQLSERCVMDRTELSIEIANLRARLREVDPQFPKADA